ANRALRDGDFAGARALAEERCAADPLDEPAHVLLMKALAGEGRRSDALAVFARLRRRLAADLGVSPGGEATAVHAELLADDDTRAPTPRRRGRTVGLRADPTPLIGREEDLAALLAASDAHRVVTVLGPGGVGKTRMANTVGNVLAERGLPVFFVPLASVRDNDDVVAALAQALDVGETDMTTPGRPRLQAGDLADRLADAVRGRESVLILDNCEQVVDACARIVDDLIATEPQLRVLTTSRAPLQIAAEQVYPLPVLDVDGTDASAVELFTVRARAVRPDVDLPADTVVDLCRHLDGLPLAIELAAARTRTLSVDEIAQRLAERFDLLRSADRTAPDRHRTLRAVIGWSWDLLDEDARDALRRLCRFPAGFSADAAARVLSAPVGDPGVDDVLDALVNQSLLGVADAAGHTRYRMLEMVREFGEEQLDDATGVPVDAAMAAWARRFATDIRRRGESGTDRALINDVAIEVENLIWVLRRALADRTGVDGKATPESATTIVTVFPLIAAFWGMRGMHAEIHAWAQRILDALPPPPVDPDEQTRELWQATLLGIIGQSLGVRDLRGVGRGRAALRRLYRRDLRLQLPLELLGSLAVTRSIPDGVRTVVRAAESDNPEVRQLALALRHNLRENAGNLTGAMNDAEALRGYMNPDDPFLSSMISVSTASVYSQQGRWEEAVGFYRTGASNLASIGADDDEQQARGFLVGSLIAMGRYDEADRELAILADGWRPGDPVPQGNPEAIAGMMLAFAELAAARGEPSLEMYEQAGRLLVDGHPMAARDPGALMVLSVIVAGLALGGSWRSARTVVSAVLEGMTQMFTPRGWHDVPQAATMALATGLVLSGDPDVDDGQTRLDGAELMLLADRLGARRDYRSLNEVRDDMRAHSPVTDAQWEELADRVASMSRRDAIDEFFRLVQRVR
ncbi:ATP-binding protein, partial [Gordonia sp. (in: high G+C Gram-positive bacteria)]|uniref:ATP-binding protein n=1 Tax=Gordonia sp. (in: high G+C Gram-positive bacteria) TaxID=84139 RepID=UPI0039E2F41D